MTPAMTIAEVILSPNADDRMRRILSEREAYERGVCFALQEALNVIDAGLERDALHDVLVEMLEHFNGQYVRVFRPVVTHE